MLYDDASADVKEMLPDVAQDGFWGRPERPGCGCKTQGEIVGNLDIDFKRLRLDDLPADIVFDDMGPFLPRVIPDRYDHATVDHIIRNHLDHVGGQKEHGDGKIERDLVIVIDEPSGGFRLEQITTDIDDASGLFSTGRLVDFVHDNHRVHAAGGMNALKDHPDYGNDSFIGLH